MVISIALDRYIYPFYPFSLTVIEEHVEYNIYIVL